MRRTPSRRQLLTGAAALATTAVAGCLGSFDALGGDSNGEETIEPVEPPEERDGTPEEFYYFLESNGIEVAELTRRGDGLHLTYHSAEETPAGSDEEIGIIYQVYKQALIDRGSEITSLTATVADPFDGQPHSWMIDTDWIHEYDSPDEESDESDALALWEMIERTKDYGDVDPESDEEADMAEGEDATNETESDDGAPESDGT